MRPRFLLCGFQIAALVVCGFALAENTLAQGAASSETTNTEVVLTKLTAPVYPPLARQAHITGDVVVGLSLREDGSVVAADVTSGHPMLKMAALESARRSVFECRGCEHAITVYFLTYTFGLRDDVDCSVWRVRSAKCLYLWRCGAWRNAKTRMPAVTQMHSHITILADSACIETEAVPIRSAGASASFLLHTGN
jgi:hypothetical protein